MTSKYDLAAEYNNNNDYIVYLYGANSTANEPQMYKLACID